MAGKKSEARSVKLDAETERRIRAVCLKYDLQWSDLIRVGIKIVLPLAEENPHLIKHLAID
jgi:hypothetical protein